jgi:hypothetical protein
MSAAEASFRYLTKLCDQVLCLISQEHADKIVWKTSRGYVDADDENVDRLFSFEVAKTNEQEERVDWRIGFEVWNFINLHEYTNLILE